MNNPSPYTPLQGLPLGKWDWVMNNINSINVPEIIKEAAKKLRNNMTDSEVILWNHIKWWDLGVKFLRQKPVYVFTEESWLDRYIIPDFYCFDRKIIIEVDGSIHDLEEVYTLDRHKEELLQNQWFRILRVTNKVIEKDIKSVILNIKLFL